jgi:uncharacterized protein YegL
MFEKEDSLLKCPCGYSGKNFKKINFILNDSALTVEDEYGIKTEKAFQFFACPVCGTVKLPLPALPNACNDNVPAYEFQPADHTVDASFPLMKRTVYLVFMIDTSGSMDGSKIGAVNSAFEELTLELKSMIKDYPGLRIKIGVLRFSSGASWMTPDSPVSIEHFQWNYLKSGGVTDVGAAFKALGTNLSAKIFTGDETASPEIVLYLLTDGAPTDDWQRELEILSQNKWFRVSRKFGIAIGDDADSNMLKEFTGSMESVVESFNAAMVIKEVLQNTDGAFSRKDDDDFDW